MRVYFFILAFLIQGCLFFDTATPADENNGETVNNGVTPNNGTPNCMEVEKVNGICSPNCAKTTPFNTLCNLVCEDTCSQYIDCFPCGGTRCTDDSDCESGVCNGSVCKEEAHCWDDVISGDETDVDCGGSSDCRRCVAEESCTKNSDCEQGFICNVDDKCEEVFASCEAAFQGVNNPSNGIYLIDVGENDPVPMFCNPRLGGGAALLLVAKEDSKYWGAQSSNWKLDTPKGRLPELRLKVADQKTEAYSKLETDTIFLCLLEMNKTKCFKFTLDSKRTLMSFFTMEENLTVKYQSELSETGTPKFATNFLDTFGYRFATNVTPQCLWLGINLGDAKIGLMGDDGNGCQETLNGRVQLDDYGFGLGMDFGVASSSLKGKAGITRYVTKKRANGVPQPGTGTDPYLVGPWAVFAK